MNEPVPSAGSTNADAPFQPGEVIDFCGDRYEVVANHGATGQVRLMGDPTTVVAFRWVFEGEPCRRCVGARA